MDIALLNQKITIQKNTVVVDDIGNHISKWDDFYSCYATISGESPNESTSAGMVVDITPRPTLLSGGAKLCWRLLLTNTESCIRVGYTTSLALTTKISRRNR